MPPRDDDWTELLRRTPAPVDREAMSRCFRGKTIAITGAGGFIGSALARSLASVAPRRLILLDIAEHGLHDLEFALAEHIAAPTRDLIVGDICDVGLLASIFGQHSPDIVFHAAASKHVWLMERNPLAAARNNVLGTAAVLHAAAVSEVPDFVLVSTDKAMDPSSVMGATKRVAELLTLTHAGAMRARAVRLANVLGSSGSVVPIFESQIATGGPLTITDPACTRYFISIGEAVHALLASLQIAQASALLVTDAGAPISILALAHYLAARQGRSLDTLSVTYSGLRAGERLTEAMLSQQERALPSGVPSLRHVEGVDRPPHDALPSSIARLRKAVEDRDVSEMLSALALILPRYQPSAFLRQQAESGLFA